MIPFNAHILSLQGGDDRAPHLLGSRCTACGAYFFPQQGFCTECLKEGTIEEAALSTRGTIYSFTVVERGSLAPPGFKAPYAYGYIDMPEKVRVLAKILDWTRHTLRIGTSVELTVEEIRRDTANEQIMGFAFRIV
jgi:uncharacterized OB-fold protein